MILTFLGTGTSQGIPVIGCKCEVCTSVDFRDQRLRASAHIATEGKSIVIDTGPDFRQQMLRERIKTVDALLFTHEHKDHTAGLDDIRSYNFRQEKYIPVYGRKRTIDQIKNEFAYAFTEPRYPGVPLLEMHEIENKPFSAAGVEVTPIDLLHHKLPVFGYRIKDLTYITDANFIPDAELEKIRGSKVIVLNALQKTEHISHFTLQQAVDILTDLKPEVAYLIHLSHKMGLHRDVERDLPDFIHIAYDGLKVEI